MAAKELVGQPSPYFRDRVLWKPGPLTAFLKAAIAGYSLSLGGGTNEKGIDRIR